MHAPVIRISDQAWIGEIEVCLNRCRRNLCNHSFEGVSSLRVSTCIYRVSISVYEGDITHVLPK